MITTILALQIICKSTIVANVLATLTPQGAGYSLHVESTPARTTNGGVSIPGFDFYAGAGKDGVYGKSVLSDPPGTFALVADRAVTDAFPANLLFKSQVPEGRYGDGWHAVPVTCLSY